jgi:membrane protein implicated in regulation of membrane protease activity
MFNNDVKRRSNVPRLTTTLFLLILAGAIVAALVTLPLPRLSMLSLSLGLTALAWVVLQRWLQPGHSSEREVDQQLHEIDVMLAYGRVEQAQQRLQTLQQRYPHHPEIAQRLDSF